MNKETMPEYELLDFDGRFCWIRLPNGKYGVDERYEQEFIEFWNKIQSLEGC